MSACIYHDAEAVTICPSCDFAVCQQCVDGGTEGLCIECSSSQAAAAAAVPAEEVPRCKYCRIASDDETPLDTDGYCEACQALPRCNTHDELIAFGNCKSCRSPYCRKCLGFNDVCEACTAKQKAAPPRPKPAAAGTGPIKKGPNGPKKGTGPTRRPDGPKPKRPRPPAAGAEAPKRRKKGEPELDEKGRPKKKPASRGTQAMEAKLESKMHGRARKQLIATAVVVGACAIVLLSGLVMRASSAENQGRAIEEQMVVVHQAVTTFYKKHNRLPSGADEIKGAVDPKGGKIKVADKPTPSAVIYQLNGEEGFLIMGTDAKGETLKAGNGNPLAYDQFFTP